MGNIFATAVSFFLGALVAVITVLGLINAQVNSAAQTTSDINNPTITYGSTN